MADTIHTIPIWKTSLASIAVIVAHFGTWFRLSALVLGIILAILLGSALLTMDAMQALFEQFPEMTKALEQVANGQTSEEEFLSRYGATQDSMNLVGALNMLGLLVWLGSGAMLLVRWCRFAALGDDAVGRWMVLRFGSLELEMLGALIIWGLIFFVGFIAVFIVATLAVAVAGPIGYAVMLVLYVALFVVITRLALLFPQVACNGGLDLFAVWWRTRGNTWRIFCVALNIGFLSFVVLLIGMALVGFVLYAAMPEGVFKRDADIEQAIADMLPLWIILSSLFNVLFVAGHVVFAAMLGLIHAQVVARPEDHFI